jgi:hypothetical protein
VRHAVSAHYQCLAVFCISLTLTATCYTMANTTYPAKLSFCTEAPRAGCFAPTTPGSLACCWAAQGSPTYVRYCADGLITFCVAPDVNYLEARLSDSYIDHHCVTSSASPRLAAMSYQLLFLAALLLLTMVNGSPVSILAPRSPVLSSYLGQSANLTIGATAFLPFRLLAGR